MRSGMIAIVGRPNAGKSTLVNHIIGEPLAAVSPKAQTTRRRFKGIRTIGDTQMIFLDTPGLHVADKKHRLNRLCVGEAASAAVDADVLVYLVDASRKFQGLEKGTDEYFVLKVIRESLAERSRPLFVVLNKIDAVQRDQGIQQDELTEAIRDLPVSAVVMSSAKTGQGVERLVDLLQTAMPEGPHLYEEDDLTDANMRTIAGDLIQEQLFLQLGDELPYQCTVEITGYRDPQEGQRKTEIDATIHVERDSQKGMVVGKQGQKIKAIGIAARKRIEQVLGQPIILKLHAHVLPAWTQDFARLERLGYTQPNG